MSWLKSCIYLASRVKYTKARRGGGVFRLQRWRWKGDCFLPSTGSWWHMHSSSQPPRDCTRPSTSGKAALGCVLHPSQSCLGLRKVFWNSGAWELTCTLLKGSDQWQRPPELRMACIKPRLPGASPHLLVVGELSAFAICQQFFHCHGGPCTNRPHPIKPASRTNPGGNLWGVSDIIPPNGKAIFLKAISGKLPRSHGLPSVHPKFGIRAVRVVVYKFAPHWLFYVLQQWLATGKNGVIVTTHFQSMKDTTMHVLKWWGTWGIYQGLQAGPETHGYLSKCLVALGGWGV